jgi:DNA processing protein
MAPRVIRRGDPEWPRMFAEFVTEQPIRRLFVDGRPLPSGERAVAVVGSRRPTSAGIYAASAISRGLAEAGFTVVSGLAVGIDAVAHKTALDCSGHTVAVLGCGHGVDYPRVNSDLRKRIARSGTIVSEYERDVQPQRFHFPERNRIIAALSAAVVFVEGGPKSGGLITARHAFEAGREVFAVPGSFRNPLAAGPNELIRTCGARLVTDVAQILEDLAPGLVWSEDETGPPVGDPAVNETEARVLLFLDESPTPPDRICMDLDMTWGEAALALAALEALGYVDKRPAGYAVTPGGARARGRLPVRD